MRINKKDKNKYTYMNRLQREAMRPDECIRAFGALNERKKRILLEMAKKGNEVAKYIFLMSHMRYFHYWIRNCMHPVYYNKSALYCIQSSLFLTYELFDKKSHTTFIAYTRFSMKRTLINHFSENYLPFAIPEGLPLQKIFDFRNCLFTINDNSELDYYDEKKLKKVMDMNTIKEYTSSHFDFSTIHRNDYRSLVKFFLRQLDSRSRLVLSKLFGLDGHEIQSTYQIGRECNISRQRIHQIYRHSIAILRRYSKKNKITSLFLER